MLHVGPGSTSPQEMHSPSVKINEDALHRVRSAPATGHSTGVAGGIFHARSNSRLSVDARSVRRPSNEPAPEVARDVEEGDDWRGGHEKKKQVFCGWTLLWLSYQSIGVIYGDIGTSSLYVFSSTFLDGPPDYEGLVQVLSVIIWSLAIMVTLKYVFVILHFQHVHVPHQICKPHKPRPPRGSDSQDGTSLVCGHAPHTPYSLP
jgi:KUP system potassium uptake protein